LNASPNMGALSMTYLSGSKDPIFNVITTYTPATTLKGTSPNTFYHLRLTTSNAPSGSEPALAFNTPYKIGRFRVSSTTNWTNALNPFLPPAGLNNIQLVNVSGYTQCILNALVNGSTTTYSLFGTANTPGATSYNVLTASIDPNPTGTNPFLLNTATCNNTSTATTASACDTYTWSANAQPYTASGIYTRTSLIGAGPCINTDSLYLTINVSTSSSTSASACDTYTWSTNGQTYTASGTYTATSLNAAGCVHASTLVLSLNTSSNSTSNATACNTYTWTTNGQTYTNSGTYTYSTTGTNGCVQNYTLNLTINTSTSNTTNATVCSPYTWAANGQTYTTAGTYTATSLNAAGCTHTETLNLAACVIPPAVTYTFNNLIEVSPPVFEFDSWVTNTGTGYIKR